MEGTEGRKGKWSIENAFAAAGVIHYPLHTMGEDSRNRFRSALRVESLCSTMRVLMVVFGGAYDRLSLSHSAFICVSFSVRL